jgi:hypothetical protein
MLRKAPPARHLERLPGAPMTEYRMHFDAITRQHLLRIRSTNLNKPIFAEFLDGYDVISRLE